MNDAENQPGRLPLSRRHGEVALGCVAVALLVAASALLMVYPASHDELHFAHGAWLAQQGEQPFADFLWHNSTGVLYLLRACALWNPDFGPEVLAWGRALCIASLWASAFFLYRLGSLAHSPAVGWTTLIIVAPLWALPRNGELLYKPHWCIRPEVIVMPLALAALDCVLRLMNTAAQSGSATAARRGTGWFDRSFWLGLFASTIAGGALFVSPRLVHMCFALAIIVLIWWRSLPRSALLGMFAGLPLAPALYLLLIGSHDTYLWIARYATSVRSEDLPRFGALRAHVGKGVMAAALLESLYCLWRAPNVNVRRLAVVQLILSSAVLSESQPAPGTYQLTVTLGSLLFAYLLVSLAQSRTLLAWSVLGTLLAACWIYPLRDAHRVLGVMSESYRPRLLVRQIDVFAQLRDALAGETVLMDPEFNIVAARDASYFWTQFSRLRPVLAKLHYDHPIDVIEDCRKHPPAILWRRALDDVAATPSDESAIDELIARNYDATANGFLVRRDRKESLGPLLEDPAVSIHLRHK